MNSEKAWALEIFGMHGSSSKRAFFIIRSISTSAFIIALALNAPKRPYRFQLVSARLRIKILRAKLLKPWLCTSLVRDRLVL